MPANRKVTNWLWYLWQLPQNLLGLAVIRHFRRTGRLVNLISPHDAVRVAVFGPYLQTDSPNQIAAQAQAIPGPARAITDWKIAIVTNVPNMGAVSLGKYLIINNPNPVGLLIAHERGHQVQSRQLGPLYLLVVGVPSALRAFWQQKRHTQWSRAARNHWYYRGWPESAANRHGGVTQSQWSHWSRTV